MSNFPKGKGREIRVERTEYKGKGYLHIREWYQGEGGGKMFPGKGIALPADMAKEVLEAGLEELKRAEVAEPENLSPEEAAKAIEKLQKFLKKEKA